MILIYKSLIFRNVFEETFITQSDAIAILKKDEGHFFDVTTKLGSGITAQKKCVAFANSDGGELLIGILDKKQGGLSGGIFERWRGFTDQEEANSFVQNIFIQIKPTIENISFEFLIIKDAESNGKVLKINIEKSSSVHKTSDGKVYVRKGAQCLEIRDDAIWNLKLSKGATSYENQSVANYDMERLHQSVALRSFLEDYSPKTNPEIFLKKQALTRIEENKTVPIYAAVLLYDENPSAVLNKKCAVKIVRYDTSENIPERIHLKEQKTVEGFLYLQINQCLKIIQQLIEAVPIMGSSGLENAKYPPEAIKEILVNALIHRDYNISDDVLVFIFNNRIEIQSPGALPGHITIENILEERFARNNKIVRMLNKYPDLPNRDIGEGLNTAFQKMKEVRLKEPVIEVKENRVIVTLPHQELASPEEQIIDYLKLHTEINNETARNLTGQSSENKVKKYFYNLRDKSLIERVPDKNGSSSAWRLKNQESIKSVFDISNKAPASDKIAKQSTLGI